MNLALIESNPLKGFFLAYINLIDQISRQWQDYFNGKINGGHRGI